MNQDGTSVLFCGVNKKSTLPFLICLWSITLSSNIKEICQHHLIQFSFYAQNTWLGTAVDRKMVAGSFSACHMRSLDNNYGELHHGESVQNSSQNSEIPDRPGFCLLDGLYYGEFQGQFPNLSKLQFF